jgi:hypothetical protein
MTDELEVLSRLVDYHDHIAPPVVPIVDDVRRGRRRVRRNRGIMTGAVAVSVAGVVMTASLITGGDRDAGPAPAVPSPTPVTPSPTPAKSQSPQTWVDTTVATHDGYGWDVPDPLQAARNAWFAVAVDHLDPTGEHFDPRDKTSSPFVDQFTWREEGSLYPVSGRMGLIVDRGELDPFDGCRYLMAGPEPSNGSVSCSAERFAGQGGERARISRWGRRCGAYEGGGPAPAICGDYRVAVAVERRDGLIGYVVVDGRGTPDFIPFTPAAMAAAAADPRLTLPESAFAVPSDQAVESVMVDHFPGYRAGAQDAFATEHPGYAQAWGSLGRLGLNVTVRPAGGTPTCGRSWLTECVERRVFGADDPTTVFVGAWDEEDWASCCPKNSRATSRVFVYVGPRHTVVVGESLVVKADEEAVGAELDQRVIDLLLDPRLQ